MASPPVTAKLADGTTVLFAIDVDGRLWIYEQKGASPYWRSLGDADLAGQVAAVDSEDGLRLIALDTSGAAKTARYFTNGGTLSSWTSMGGSGLTGTPAVLYPGYQTRVFARASDGTIVTKMQDTTGAFPATWDPVGGMVAAGSPAPILDPVLGRTAVVVRGTDNEIYAVWETAQGSGVWGSWAKAAPNYPSATDPTVTLISNDNGQSWVIVFRDVNDQTWVWQRQLPGSTMTAAQAAPTFIGHTLPAPPKA